MRYFVDNLMVVDFNSWNLLLIKMNSQINKRIGSQEYKGNQPHLLKAPILISSLPLSLIFPPLFRTANLPKETTSSYIISLFHALAPNNLQDVRRLSRPLFATFSTIKTLRYFPRGFGVRKRSEGSRVFQFGDGETMTAMKGLASNQIEVLVQGKQYVPEKSRKTMILLLQAKASFADVCFLQSLTLRTQSLTPKNPALTNKNDSQRLRKESPPIPSSSQSILCLPQKKQGGKDSQELQNF